MGSSECRQARDRSRPRRTSRKWIDSRDGSPLGAVQEPLELVRCPDDMQFRLRRVGGDGSKQRRPGSVTPGDHPPPEVKTLAGSAGGSPQTACESEVEDEDGVRSDEPRCKDVMGPEISVDDPSLGGNEVGLHCCP